MDSFVLDMGLARELAQIALGHVTREYPNKLDHLMTERADVQSPRALHPVFYGSFDWHSCVHGYWLLARLRRAIKNLFCLFQTSHVRPAIITLTAIQFPSLCP